MSSEPSDSLYDQIYKKLQEKETEELLEIWQENNRDEWSDNAFAAIYEILLERLGSEPPSQQPPPEAETGKYLFFDLDKVISLSDNINTIAWVVLSGWGTFLVVQLLPKYSFQCCTYFSRDSFSSWCCAFSPRF